MNYGLTKRHHKRRTPWTPQELSYLKAHKTDTIASLATTLGRSESSVRNKLKRLGYIKTHPNRSWSKEEEEYLYRYYGRYSVSVLANHLHRTNAAVKHKAESLGLVVYSEYWSLKLLSHAFQVDIRVLHRWHDKLGMPWSASSHNGHMYYRVDEEAFWKWALLNKEEISWHKYIPGSLSGEPSWLPSVIAGSAIPRRNRESYTPSEISQIRSWHHDGVAMEVIAGRTGRSVEAIKHVLRVG